MNAAILAGNPPQWRVDRLREFWREVPLQADLDPTLLAAMLPRVVDFDYLNQAALPLVVCSVYLQSGEPVYFDSLAQTIGPKHVLASMALIPGLPPVEIDGRLLADPGMLGNLPLDPLLREPLPGDHVCFAIDMSDACSRRAFSMDTALERMQDNALAGRSLRTIEAFRREYRLRKLLAQQDSLAPPLLGGVPGEWPHAWQQGRHGETQVVLLAHRSPVHEVAAKAEDFAAHVRGCWAAGLEDMRLAIAALEAGRATTRDPGFSFYDCRRSMARGQGSAQ